jgi:alkylation response protein AidB-like acyl-CoA dehydrogenase
VSRSPSRTISTRTGDAALQLGERATDGQARVVAARRRHRLERAVRDARLGPIGGGTDEIMREIWGVGCDAPWSRN